MGKGELNLPTPPGFRGLHPDLPIHRYDRHLPHWRQEGATYFVTFRTRDSIPQEQVRALRLWRERWEQQHPEPRSERDWVQLACEITHKTEAYLDHGYGHCPLADPEQALVMQHALLHFQYERCFIPCFTLMPNHVHVLVKPLPGCTLERWLQSVKGYTGRMLNERLGRKGPVWSEESYDRIVRDEEHLYKVVQYIGRNGLEAKLPPDRWFRWVHPHWQSVGWGFRD